MTTYLALDLETVLDVQLGQKVWPELTVPAFEDRFGTDKQKRMYMRLCQLEATQQKSDFLKPLFHQIVAVGMAFYDPASGVSRSTSWVGLETTLIATVTAALAKKPTLVTYNGRMFDLPVLMQCGLVHGLDMRTLYGPHGGKAWDAYQYRYGGPHLDLADVVTNYGACAMPKLNELLLACGMAPKTGDGADVEAMVDDQAWPLLLEYVKADAEKTLLLALRFEQGRGRLDPSSTLDLFA